MQGDRPEESAFPSGLQSFFNLALSVSEEESWAGDGSGWSPGFMSDFGARPRWAVPSASPAGDSSVCTDALEA